MRIQFRSTLNRLKLMSWHRKFFESSPIQAKQFVDSIPCEIEISEDVLRESHFQYIFSTDIENQLKEIAVFEVLPDSLDILPAKDFPTCGCQYQPANFISCRNYAFITNSENK